MDRSILSSDSNAEVFLARLPERDIDGALFPDERQREIAAKNSSLARRESFFAWRLLELAVSETLALTLEEAGLSKTGGRWSARDFDFSISHGGDAVAVAISDAGIGIDIESLSSEDDGERIARRFFTEDELASYLSSDPAMRREEFLRIWTAKEAIFKSRAESAFEPSEVNSHSQSVYTEVVSLGERDYVVSVATDRPVIIHSDIVL